MLDSMFGTRRFYVIFKGQAVIDLCFNAHEHRRKSNKYVVAKRIIIKAADHSLSLQRKKT